MASCDGGLAYPDFGLHIQVREEGSKEVTYQGRFVVSSRIEGHQCNSTYILWGDHTHKKVKPLNS